jgi:hypothetical protein
VEGVSDTSYTEERITYCVIYILSVNCIVCDVTKRYLMLSYVTGESFH